MGESSRHTSAGISSRRRDSRSRSPDRGSSRRHRSRSPRRSSHRSRDDDVSRDKKDRSDRGDRDRRDRREREDRSPSDDEGGPPAGVDEISEDDYFIKATELKLWLWEEKGKKLDSLKTEDARRYFRRFVRSWNRGRLDGKFYAGISPASLPSSISTTHSWSFSKASQSDLDAAASVRKSIDTGTKTRSYDPTARGSASAGAGAVAGPSRPSAVQLGPAMPPSSAVERLQMERDARDSTRETERAAYGAQRRKETREGRDEERDGRATGRDRLVEKRREGNANRRDFEASKEGGGMLDFDEDALMSGATGGGPAGPGSFQDALKERERQQQRREDRKYGRGEEKRAEMTDRLSVHRQKEDATMAMFKQLAAQRFGGGAS